jgi:ATP-binding cassette subfamily B protein
MHDTIENIETVKYFGNEEYEASLFKENINDYIKISTEAHKYMSLISIGQQLIISIGMSLIMWRSVLGVLDKAMSIGDLVLINSLMIQIYVPLSFIGVIYKEFRQCIVDISLISPILNSDIEKNIFISNSARHTDNNSIKLIEFNKVGFGYSYDNPIIKNLDFVIKDGTTTAIVGKTGIGKSTIIKLLMRLYEPSSGSIKINGIDISNIELSKYRSKFGVVSQDTVLFHESILFNISYGNPLATFNEIEKCSRSAMLHDTVMNMPNKYLTMVGERGVKLSGGEKQRLSIARALLKNPEIIIFDEATSSLDSSTEELFQNEMLQIVKGKTVIIIAHRLSTIVNADLILVIDNGTVVESGNHTDLINLKGIYNKLWSYQNANIL